MPTQTVEPVVETNGDLLDYAKSLQMSLGQCNADKEAIKKIVK